MTERRKRHGLRNTREYRIWACIKTRCLNPNAYNYHNYGGRGIMVCDSWHHFIDFYTDMGKAPTEKHAIDRINNELGYCKENCRWVTQKENNRNTRNNHYINGKSLAEWAEISGVNYGTFKSRINRSGWSLEEALDPSLDFSTRFNKGENRK